MNSKIVEVVVDDTLSKLPPSRPSAAPAPQCFSCRQTISPVRFRERRYRSRFSVGNSISWHGTVSIYGNRSADRQARWPHSIKDVDEWPESGWGCPEIFSQARIDVEDFQRFHHNRPEPRQETVYVRRSASMCGPGWRNHPRLTDETSALERHRFQRLSQGGPLALTGRLRRRSSDPLNDLSQGPPSSNISGNSRSLTEAPQPSIYSAKQKDEQRFHPSPV